MTLKTIVAGLTAAKHSQIDPTERARAGFLQWCLSLEYTTDMRAEARAAIAKLHYFDSDSAALAAFETMLVEATRPMPAPRRRGARRGQMRLQ